MKIESLIRPSQKPTRTVKVFDNAYVFNKTIDDKFVAEVDDPRAIEALLKLPKAYREYTEPKPALGRTKLDPADKEAVKKAEQEAAAQAKAEADAAAEAAAAVKKQEESEAANAQKAAVDAEVQALLSSTPQAIKKIVEKKIPSREVLELALASEKGSEKPRTQVINLLSGTLASLEG